MTPSTVQTSLLTLMMRWMSDLSEVPTIVDMIDYEYIYAVKFASLH